MLDKKVVEKSTFIHKWIEDNVLYFKMLYPQAKEEDLREILIEIAEKYGFSPRAVIYNNYDDGKQVNSDLLSIYEWVEQTKPICGGNGTFFKNQDKKTSPIAKVITGRISTRKQYQRTRDQYDQSSYEYRYYDMMQKEAKIKINSIYGSFGATTFQLYNIFTAAATTGTAQSLISTTAVAFEGFLSDNARFRSIDEFMIYVGDVLHKTDYTYNYSIVPIIRDPGKVYDRMVNHFLEGVEVTDSICDIIWRVLENCNEEQLTRLYYKNNLYDFIDTPIIHDIMLEIFNTATSFRNPNAVPEELYGLLDQLWDYTNEFVFYNHAYTERINRLVHYKRRSVIIIDTDSNMINIEPWVGHLQKTVWEQSGTSMDDDNKLFASVNGLVFLVTRMVQTLLKKYCEDCNLLDEYAKRVNMKNEFYYARMLLADVKKRYAARTRLQEGVEIKVGSRKELDVKGYDFRKAGVNEDISNKLYSILLECIMRPEKINISRILAKLDFIERDIKESLKCGKRTYLLRMNCKSPRAYSNPDTQGAVLGPMLWNVAFPENEIEIPDKLDVVILNNVTLEQLETMEAKFPNEVDRIRKFIFNGPQKKHFEEKGLVYLALPNDGSGIPELFIPFINVDKIVTRNIGTFEPVMDALGIPMVSGSKDYKYFGNILNI